MDRLRIEDIFGEALSLSLGERDAYLTEVCAGDDELRNEVESLLEAHEDAGTFMREPSVLSVPGASELAEAPGTVIGRYELLEQIGEGGFGTVFLAEQREPVQREVAVKIIKLGMDTKQVIARFEAERQALAMMDHPDIARVLDAGATETGRPYFVMELVRGEPITAYCDREELTLRARLELFARVCSAVQHAHQKGIIHRDLKPSNVLVAEIDGRPVPKIIDFGIAKATGGAGLVLTDKTLFTSFGQFVGTPEYMSPEQAGRGVVDIDTRTDIYSLGALLYALLTGGPPFDPGDLRSATWEEMRRMVREAEPPTPSTRLRSRPDTGEVAARRHSQPARLVGQIRGELDWIVMKCLEKDRDRRYETANALALDVRRYLDHEPVLAGPPSRAYRLRKLIRRNQGFVVAASLVAGALVTGLGAAVWQAVLAHRAAERAEGQWRLAETRADETKRVAEFQARMLGRIDATDAGVKLMRDMRERYSAALEKLGVPDAERKARVSSFAIELARVNATDTAVAMIERTVLQPAVDAAEREFADQPVVDATLRMTLARLYIGLGKYDEAQPLLRRALRTRQRELGEDHRDTLQSLNMMGLLLGHRGQLRRAERHVRGALERRERLFGDEDPDTIQSRINMGYLLFRQSKHDDAERYFRPALEQCRRVLGDDHPDTLKSINNMGMLLRAQNKPQAAEVLLRESLEKSRETLGEDHWQTLAALQNLAGLLRVPGRFGEAERYSEEAVDKSRRLMGEWHPVTVYAVHTLGRLFAAQGKFAEAEPRCREAYEKAEQVLGEDNPHTLMMLNNLGALLHAQGKLEAAEPILRDSLTRTIKKHGENARTTFMSINNLASLLTDLGKFEQAVQHAERALAKCRELLGEEDRTTLVAINNLGNVLFKQGKHAEAEPLLREAMKKSEKVLGEDNGTTLAAIDNLGSLLRAQGKLAEAERHARRALAKYRAVFGKHHPDTYKSLDNTLKVLTDQAKRLYREGKPDQSERYLRDAVKEAEEILGKDHEVTLSAVAELGSLLRAQSKFVEAEQQLLPAAETAEKKLSPRHPVRLALARRIVRLYEEWDEAEPGGGFDAKAAEWQTRIAPKAESGSRGR